MARVELKSTSIHAAAYQDQGTLLELEFRSGAVYRYLTLVFPHRSIKRCWERNPRGSISTGTYGIASPMQKPIPQVTAPLAILTLTGYVLDSGRPKM
jgi:hypothetical protein